MCVLKCIECVQNVFNFQFSTSDSIYFSLTKIRGIQMTIARTMLRYSRW